jgi:hypothetical protein
MEARRKLPAGKLAVGYPSQRDEAVLNAGGIRCESSVYDFSSDAGAVGTISFGRHLPAGAVVTRVFSDEQTALTSAGSATVQLKAGSTNLTDALEFDTGFAGVQSQELASSATAIKVAAESELNIAIAGAALTAGKVRFFVEYLLQNDSK